MFENEFAGDQKIQGTDWIQVACDELLDEVIDETLTQLEQNEAFEKMLREKFPNEEDRNKARDLAAI
jgi:hypothetical protein